MPYRVDLPQLDDDALDRLVELGALDAETLDSGGLAALMPDSVAPSQVSEALGIADVRVSPARGRDDGSTWTLSPRPVVCGRFHIVPDSDRTSRDAIRLIDSAAFGTGLHPTTALCLQALEDAVSSTHPDSVLDVGTGSGVLALAALKLGVPRVSGIDVDDEALRAAAENARINGVADRLALSRGSPDTITGAWPLVLANVLAAPLIEMAPALVRLIGHRGDLVLSGIPASVQPDVDEAYNRLGMQRTRVMSRGGWVALVLRASW